ncbi:unnamed protein product [Amoebophrya sp. A120]|nr:unnamed protein product [Amoebophrya sp. A120]|eukprot:GSA120T00023724001.1
MLFRRLSIKIVFGRKAWKAQKPCCTKRVYGSYGTRALSQHASGRGSQVRSRYTENVSDLQSRVSRPAARFRPARRLTRRSELDGLIVTALEEKMRANGQGSGPMSGPARIGHFPGRGRVGKTIAELDLGDEDPIDLPREFTSESESQKSWDAQSAATGSQGTAEGTGSSSKKIQAEYDGGRDCGRAARNRQQRQNPNPDPGCRGCRKHHGGTGQKVAAHRICRPRLHLRGPRRSNKVRASKTISIRT